MVKKRIVEAITATDPKTKRWKSLFSAAKIAYESGELRQAESLLARARELARELKDSAFAINASEIGAGAVILAKRDVREAAARLQKSINNLRGSSDNNLKELLGIALRFHAQALVDSGDERTAEKELKESAEILGDLGTDACVQLAYTLCDLCGLYVKTNRISEAEQFITSAIEILFAVLGPDSPQYVHADLIYAVCREQEDRDGAVSEGIRQMQFMYGEQHPYVARMLERYMVALDQKGDTTRLEEAKNKFSVGSKLLIGNSKFSIESLFK